MSRQQRLAMSSDEPRMYMGGVREIHDVLKNHVSTKGRRKYRSPSPDSSSDEMEGGGWASSLFNIGRAVANTATKIQPSVTKLAPAITRVDTAAAALSRAGTTEAKAASLARAAEAQAAAAKAAAAAEAPVGFGTRLMNTASALGNLAMLGANIAAPIYMSVDQHLNDLKADEAQRKADALAAERRIQEEKDQANADKLNKDISAASKAQQDAYNLVIQILQGTSGTGTGTGTTTSGANSQDVIDILNTITAVTNPPPTTPPPPTSTPNTYVPIIPPPPQPPAVIPTQPPTPVPTVPPVPITPKPPTKPPTQAPVPPKSNLYRGQGRRRGGVTHASHKKDIMKLLETHYR